MNRGTNPLAGHPAPRSALISVARLVTAYFAEVPDPDQPGQRVAFGTSGHRGCACDRSFNEWHVLSISQAICDLRRSQGVDGPLFLGIDTHALSEPACASVLEVLAANGVEVRLAPRGEYTPTPAISHAIVTHNRGRRVGLADGIVLTPSHNPPRDGGLKYNPPHGGAAGPDITDRIQLAANRLLALRLKGVKRVSHSTALRAETTQTHDFLDAYVRDLATVVNLDAIRDLKIRMGADAMARLIGCKDEFDIAFACDTDHDRHGIVTRGAGLLPSNHYLSVAIDYLFSHRPRWGAGAAIGKTAVSTQLIDRVALHQGRRLVETPPGFKWFATGLHDGSIGFAGEESAGATFLRRDGSTWITDKDGMAAALLAAEITVRRGRDPGVLYGELTDVLGCPVAERVEAPAGAAQKLRLATLTPRQVVSKQLAGEPIEQVVNRVGDAALPLGGIKVIARNGWFAARPSGTEDLYKIYAESFLGRSHLTCILEEGQALVDSALAERDPT
ncbi:MAG: alpha-D-glucose phosphate-specific phosphoglucomutase [Burkholderiaceae bacterium]|nr:alpha-D-glucose phosphate-specific phosphoglucomutase [Burkholderiaceae bacterium]